MKPIDAALARLQEGESAHSSAVASQIAQKLATPLPDPEVKELVADFLVRVPLESATDLVSRSWFERPIEYRSGLLRRKHVIEAGSTGWETTPVARGWSLSSFGTDYEVQSHDGDGYPTTPRVVVRRTLAVTTEGELYFAADFLDGLVVIDGDAGMRAPSRPAPNVGKVRGSTDFRAAIAKELGLTHPRLRTGDYQQLGGPASSWQEVTVPTPDWNVQEAVIRGLASAMARVVHNAG